MKVWKVTGAVAYNPVLGAVTVENTNGIDCVTVDVWLHWWDRLRGVTLQQKLEHEVLRRRVWCSKRNHQEIERAEMNQYLNGMVRRLNEKDKAKKLPSGIEIRKL